MADIVSVQYLNQGGAVVSAHLLGQSDGTGETDVVKINLNDLRMPDGKAPDAVQIEEVYWNVDGYNFITLSWDRQPSDIVALQLKGDGCRDYCSLGGLSDPNRDLDGTGNLVLTTNGATSGGSYMIDIKLRLYRKH